MLLASIRGRGHYSVVSIDIPGVQEDELYVVLVYQKFIIWYDQRVLSIESICIICYLYYILLYYFYPYSLPPLIIIPLATYAIITIANTNTYIYIPPYSLQ